MSNANSELDVWRDAWRVAPKTSAPSRFDLRREARRQERWLRTRYVLAFVWALVFLAFSAFAVRRGHQGLLWAGVVWLTTFVALGFSVWNWRSVWQTANSSTSEFAELYEKRCLATLRAVHFGYRFLGLQMMIAVPWLTWDFYRKHEGFGLAQYAGCLVLLACLSALFAISFSRKQRRTQRELKELKAFREGLAEDVA